LRSVLSALIAAVSVATTTSAAAPPPTPSAQEAYAFAFQLANAGPRPAGSPAERRAHQEVAKRFRTAGLRTGFEHFSVPGKGTSRDVIGIRDTPAHCLVVVMAHADTVPPAPGADDNASGVGTLVALAPVLAEGQAPKCDTWLVATGSEERPYTKQPDHLGAKALVKRLRRTNRLQDVRLALSLDEVGRGTRFELRSPVPRARATVEAPILAAAKAAHVDVTWLRDSATGNSDHREFALAGAPATKLGVPDEPFRHTAKDTPDRLQRGAFARVLRVVWPLLREVS
jgi:Zn-dependent M28 family amino/carboxypeptidase